MKTILAAAAALSLLSFGALAAAPGVSCTTNPTTPQPSGQGTGTVDPPAGPTCETMVAPTGQMTLQNGPGANDNGADTAPHEGTGGGTGGAAASGGAAK
jgi:hypothetical protein